MKNITVVEHLKRIILFLLLTCNMYIQAQIQFEKVPPPPPAPQNIADFDGVQDSSIAFADINGDGDQDVLITGQNSFNQFIAKLYANDGNGNFTEVSGTPFDSVRFSSIAFADVDGDNDQDVLITGTNSSGQRIAKLYTNDGSGSFTEITGTPFDGVSGGSIAFADVDADSDQDVLITGQNNSGQRIAKLFTNDGSGNFTEVSGTPFEGVVRGSIDFADVDADNDLDILITGGTNANQLIAKLYTNDGSGNFTEVSGTPFDGVHIGSTAFADVDADSDQDVLITGQNNSGLSIAKLYSNDGNGNFSEVSGTPFDGVLSSSIAFADVDDNSSQDVLIIGQNNSGLPIAKLFTNDGSGNFSEVSGTPFDGVLLSSIAFADVDSDSDQDVLITGQNNSAQRIAKLYTNDGSGNFTEVFGTPFDEVSSSSIDFADVDADGDQDVLITGQNNSFQSIAKLYTNDGSGYFTEVSGTPFEGISFSSIAFADVDADSYQDVLITGKNNSNQRIAKLYTNDGNGNFTEVSGTPFDGVSDGSIAFADVDADNDQDVIITGQNNSGQRIAKLYTNDGNGNFTEVSGIPFDGVSGGSIAFADVDADNDQDIIITGIISPFQPTAKLYNNDGNGNFNEVSGTSFDGVSSSSIAFADVDADSDLDVLITGQNNFNLPIAKLFTNDGSGNFTEVSGTPFDGVLGSSIAFADVDADNDQDVVITGQNNSGLPIAKLFTNDGSGNFTEVSETLFDRVSSSSIAFADIDADSDQDILITGANYPNQSSSKLYRNVSENLTKVEFASISFRVYPNPTQNGNFKIFSKNFSGNQVGLSLYNLNGQLLFKAIKQLESNGEINMDVSHLSKGVYILKLDIRNQSQTTKLIIN